MELKKNLLVIICLLSSIFGLVLIYVAATKIQPLEMELGEIDSQLIGRTVRVSGYIAYKNLNPAGHVFLTVSSGKAKIQVPLFAGLMSKLNENGLSEEKLEKGARISITGMVDEYRGSLQIVPRKVEDIKILGDNHNP